MGAMLGISLDSYLYLKLAKNTMSFFLSHVFSLTKLDNKREEQVLPRSGWGITQTMYIHVSKCKNSKKKKI
jgi:hypothetical protein